jgi:phage shock protein A
LQRLKQWTTSLVSRVDWMVSQVENHEAVAKSAIRDVRRAAARARVQLTRVRADGEGLLRRLAEQRESERLWRERARECADHDGARALDCLRRARRAGRRREELARRCEEHGRVEKQLVADVAAVEERLTHLQQRHNLLRTRESRAHALATVRDASDLGDGGVGDLFERWETQVLEREYEGGCSAREENDPLEDEFLELEEESELRAELDRLRGEEPVRPAQREPGQ